MQVTPLCMHAHINGSSGIRFLAVLIDSSKSFNFFITSGLTDSCSSTQDTSLDPYCTNLQTSRHINLCRSESACACTTISVFCVLTYTACLSQSYCLPT